MVNNIKTFEERVNDLVKEGKDQGYLTYEQIAKKTIDLDLDSNALDELYNVLTENQIEVRAEDEEDGSDDERDRAVERRQGEGCQQQNPRGDERHRESAQP